MSEPALVLPLRPPYTVDDLFEMPDDGNRYEVFGGALQVSPAPAPIHQIAADALARLLWATVRPHGARAITNVAVRLPDDSGPVPDIVVTTADTRVLTGALPVDQVHSVVEIVSPGSTLMDRTFKRDLYAEAGIPCYWRVELTRWRGYDGALPLVVARLYGSNGWRSEQAVAGGAAELPIAVGRHPDGTARTVPVAFDPAALVDS